MLLARKPKDDIYNHNGDYANNEYQSNNNHERYENGDQQVNEKTIHLFYLKKTRKMNNKTLKNTIQMIATMTLKTLMRIETTMPTIKTTIIKT